MVIWHKDCIPITEFTLVTCQFSPLMLNCVVITMVYFCRALCLLSFFSLVMSIRHAVVLVVHSWAA